MMAETMSLLVTFTASMSLASSGTYNIIFKMLELLNVFQVSGDLQNALCELTHFILKIIL